MMNKKELLREVYENNQIKGIEKVIKAMDVIDRKYFVGKENLDIAYHDNPINIGKGQTISQPTTVARMLLMLDLKRKMDVLEIGSGSGWNAALIAYLVYPGKISSVERIKELSKTAVSNLFNFIKQSKFKSLKIDFIFADAMDEKEEFWKRKYDRIIITAMVSEEFAKHIKKMGKELLKNRGLLLFPFEEGLELWELKNKSLNRVARRGGYIFVPLLKGRA
jgi:protein-L-isoaspartate(D-aspartate) O-methyltransferase